MRFIQIPISSHNPSDLKRRRFHSDLKCRHRCSSYQMSPPLLLSNFAAARSNRLCFAALCLVHPSPEASSHLISPSNLKTTAQQTARYPVHLKAN
ncbi:hypothetical protein A2U01_0044202 [Trifolium medium]|uniref:Uncharacterized protein n=1 Tax=Trifolium medium TaxID=97028 RepID=A0A392QGM7_9FABA|nr:hypothetical protein [Trifolium medium]